MGIRWTEEEAIDYGFRKTKDGDWVSPGELEESPRSRNSGEMPGVKRGVLEQPSEENEREEEAQESSEERSRFIIWVTSYRRRDLDPDNLCPKWYIDEVVKAGYLPDDSSKHVLYVLKEVIEVKAPEKERTRIQVFEVSYEV